MYDIYLRDNGDKGLSIEEFDKEFRSICQSHQKTGRALAFAFILFDYDHPEVGKVLYDQMYWDALNQISGRYLTVFSFNLKSEVNVRAEIRNRGQHPTNRSILHSVNNFLEKQFGIKFPQSRPLILFFQVHNNQILTPYVYELKADSVESAFHEIKDALLTAVESVERVQPEFRGNTEQIFDLIKQSLSQRELLRKANVVVNLARQVKDLFSK
jgi:hypothetical protein